MHELENYVTDVWSILYSVFWWAVSYVEKKLKRFWGESLNGTIGRGDSHEGKIFFWGEGFQPYRSVSVFLNVTSSLKSHDNWSTNSRASIWQDKTNSCSREISENNNRMFFIYLFPWCNWLSLKRKIAEN